MIELPQEVKLQILIDDLNIRCCNLQRETRFNENITIDRRGELYKEYEVAIKERELAYLELYNLICKEVEAEQDLMIETIKEIWGHVE